MPRRLRFNSTYKRHNTSNWKRHWVTPVPPVPGAKCHHVRCHRCHLSFRVVSGRNRYVDGPRRRLPRCTRTSKPQRCKPAIARLTVRTFTPARRAMSLCDVRAVPSLVSRQSTNHTRASALDNSCMVKSTKRIQHGEAVARVAAARFSLRLRGVALVPAWRTVAVALVHGR